MILKSQWARGRCFLPVWSGSFLEKLDLSEIDFENVSWSLLRPVPSCVMVGGGKKSDIN